MSYTKEELEEMPILPPRRRSYSILSQKKNGDLPVFSSGYDTIVEVESLEEFEIFMGYQQENLDTSCTDTDNL
jgi:hypothetical protein